MSDFRNYLSEQLEDTEFKEEWDSLEPEYNTIQAIIDARKKVISPRNSLLREQVLTSQISVNWRREMQTLHYRC